MLSNQKPFLTIHFNLHDGMFTYPDLNIEAVDTKYKINLYGLIFPTIEHLPRARVYMGEVAFVWIENFIHSFEEKSIWV